MSVATVSNGEREKTPEDRSNYQHSGNPSQSIALFNVGDSAWLRIPRKGNFEFTIDARKNEDGKFKYQVKDPASGKLYKAGEWVNQDRLSAS